MSPDPSTTILQALIRQGVFSSQQVQTLHHQYRTYCQKQGRNLPLDHYLIQAKVLTREQFRWLQTREPQLALPSLSHTPTPGTGPTQPTPKPGSSPSQLPTHLSRGQLTQYPVCKVLGRGGFGVVYEIEDPISHRKMAMKILRGERTQTLQVRQRFLREIQITSILEHPHIMPVYESGQLHDGSFFFVMKEFHSGTLRDLLDLPPEEAPSLMDYLEIFTKVCLALEYAHSRKIIHRDLKPDNIAVGDFGEVMVMDWGIAKVMGQDDIPDIENSGPGPTAGGDPSGSQIQTGDGQETLTQAGGIMGTPGYLSPEQAKGQGVDQRSDVYGLGSILYCILTGRPPFDGTGQERLVKLLMESPEDPREVALNRQIPAELAAITLKALATKPALRYQNVSELRQDIKLFQEGYSVTAHREGWTRRLVKWAKRNRAWATSLVAATVGVVLILAVVFWWMAREKRVKLDKYLAQAQTVLDGQSLYTSEYLRKKFPHIYGRDKDKKESRAAATLRETSLQKWMEARSLLDRAWELAPQSSEVKKKLYQVEREIGLISLLGRNYSLSKTAFERCRRLGWEEEGKRLLDQVEGVRQARAQAQLRRLAAIADEILESPPKPGMLGEYTTEVVRMDGEKVVKKLLDYLQSPNEWLRRLAVESLGRMGDRHTEFEGKDVVEWLLEKLKHLPLRNRTSEAEALVWALGRLRDPRAGLIVTLARYSMGSNSIFYKRTEVPMSWIPVEDVKTKSVSTWFRQAVLVYNQDRFEEARNLYTKILTASPQYYLAYINRGNCYLQMKQYQKAIDDYNRYLDGKGPAAMVYLNRGHAYRSMEDYDRAIKDYNLALQRNSKNPQFYMARGRAYYLSEKYVKAMRDYKTAIELNPQLAIGHYRRGEVYQKLKENHLALQSYQKALDLNPQYYEALRKKGDVLIDLNKFTEAIDHYNQALAVNPRDLDSLVHRGLAFQNQGKMDRAVQDYTQAIQISPKAVTALVNRGAALFHLKKYQPAIDDFTRALQIDPKHLNGRYYRGVCRYKLNQNQPAIDDFTRLIEINPKSVRAYQSRSFVHMRLKNYRKVIEDCTQVIQMVPQKAVPHYRRARAHDALKEVDQALSGYRRFLQLAPQSTVAKYAREYIEKHGKK